MSAQIVNITNYRHRRRALLDCKATLAQRAIAEFSHCKPDDIEQALRAGDAVLDRGGPMRAAWRAVRYHLAGYSKVVPITEAVTPPPAGQGERLLSALLSTTLRRVRYRYPQRSQAEFHRAAMCARRVLEGGGNHVEALYHALCTYECSL
jgi:hypothetical protein